MKRIYTIGIFLLILAVVVSQKGIFSITPQPLELKQWIYIFITLLAFIGMVFFQLRKQSDLSLFLFFFLYPFFNQTVFYFNIASTFFVLTPAFLYLLMFLFLSKGVRLSNSFKLLLFFCLSTYPSVLVAQNRDTAHAFFILGVGSFLLSAYIIYTRVRITKNPLSFIRRVLFSIVAGSVIYITIETVVFRIGPNDVLEIILRKFSAVSSGRYYTAGFWEPVGMGFVYSILFWVAIFYLQVPQKNKTAKWLNISSLLITFIFVWMSGSRAAFLNIAATLFMLLLLSRALGLKRRFRIRWQYMLGIGVLLIFGVYYLLPRTIQTSRSAPIPYWITPPTLTIAGKSYNLIGTTAQYYRNTIASLDSFLHKPLGTGPLNARLDENTPTRDQFPFHYSSISNLIIVGATFGWFSLGCWVILLVFITYKVFRVPKASRMEDIFSLAVIFLAILLSSLLPGSMYIGPNLNWSKFGWLLPLSPDTPGLPSEYPSIISGLVIGCLLGLLSQLSNTSKENPHQVIE
jgi:hypothetical protein